MADKRGITKDTFNGLNPTVPAPVDRHPSYQPAHNKDFVPEEPSGSKACDPITILDDDESDVAEINYFDLENDNAAPAKGNRTVSNQQVVVGYQDSEFQSVNQNHSPSSNTHVPDPARHTERHTERLAQPLFRALPQDDFSALSMQSVPGDRFKAWYKGHDFDDTRNNASGMQQKARKRNDSIALCNEKRTKNTNRKDRDVPQFEMSVLNSKRKRTMGELGYDELISPAQIESPSEKLARMAKKRQQRQGRCDVLSHNTNSGYAQGALKFDHAYGREDGRTTGGSFEPADSQILHELREKEDAISGTGDQCSGHSLVCKPSSVNAHQSTEGYRDHLIIEDPEEPCDSHVDTSGIRSTQTSTPGRDRPAHGDGSDGAGSQGLAILTPWQNYDRRRISGPTPVCGMYSPETKSPVKKSNHGDFHCPRCDSQFTTSLGVNFHFESCLAKHGNPESLKWDDHPSLRGMRKRAVRRTKDRETVIFPARAPAVQGDCANNMLGVRQIDRPAQTATMIASSPVSDSQAPSLLHLPEKQPMTKDEASFFGYEPKLDRQTSLVEHRATGGKGLSAGSLKRFRESGKWDRGMEVGPSADEAQDGGTEMPNIAYQYHVQKRVWLETVEDAIESNIGPYHTMSEANAVAKTEVQSLQTDAFEGVQYKGWSYLYKQDEYGMQMHAATVLEINVEAVVHRELVPPHQLAAIPKSAFILAPRVYVVHELQWLPSLPDGFPDGTNRGASHCQSLIHGVFSLLKMANQRGSAEYLETLTGNWGNSEYDLLKKAETKSDLDKRVRALNREDDCFGEETKLENGGFVKVWVELAVVEGPRN